MTDEQKRIITNLAETGLAEFVAAQPPGSRLTTARKVIALVDQLAEPTIETEAEDNVDLA